MQFSAIRYKPWVPWMQIKGMSEQSNHVSCISCSQCKKYPQYDNHDFSQSSNKLDEPMFGLINLMTTLSLLMRGFKCREEKNEWFITTQQWRAGQLPVSWSPPFWRLHTANNSWKDYRKKTSSRLPHSWLEMIWNRRIKLINMNLSHALGSELANERSAWIKRVVWSVSILSNIWADEQMAQYYTSENISGIPV